jgi:queuine tRNA-ribosyltransferase
MNIPSFSFKVLYTSKRSKARVGQITTPHGIIETPNFVPVGTNATLKSVDCVMADNLDIQLMFCNTYHLMLQPGTNTIAKAGGLHTFMNRKKALITDSGGFQVFSLMYGSVKDELKSKGKKSSANLVLKITEEGVTFRSYRNGDQILLTPESSVLAQKELGADIIIPFDELPPYHIDQKKLITSLHRTHRWQERSLKTHQANPQNQAMYAVVHGGVDKTLRLLSANHLSAMNFDGYAIGGSLGQTKKQLFDVVDWTVPELDPLKPNHLLGIGDLASIQEIITRGIDTFDSSHPTKCARHGLLFTHHGNIKITQSQHSSSFEPVDLTCSCFTCRSYTRAYLHHLVKAHELSFFTLASIHNLSFMVELMKNYRHAILKDLL